MTTVYLNGSFLPIEEACISVLDRGFLFGDGVYEVMPAYDGRLLCLERHLRRLDSSLGNIRLANPLTRSECASMLGELSARNGGGDLSVYLQITRGAASRDHAFPKDTRPTVFAMTSTLKPVPQTTLDAGVTAVTLEDIRWRYCHIKAIALLPNVLLRQQAVDQGAAEALLIRDGRVTEGAASNVFIVHGGTLITPPADALLLPGITRELVLELARANGIESREDVIDEDALRDAEEIWITSSTREILPVTRLDDDAVGSGQPGPVWRRVYQLYQDYKHSLRTAD